MTLPVACIRLPLACLVPFPSASCVFDRPDCTVSWTTSCTSPSCSCAFLRLFLVFFALFSNTSCATPSPKSNAFWACSQPDWAVSCTESCTSPSCFRAFLRLFFVLFELFSKAACAASHPCCQASCADCQLDCTVSCMESCTSPSLSCAFCIVDLLLLRASSPCALPRPTSKTSCALPTLDATLPCIVA